MIQPSWFIEVALNVQDRLLQWQPLQAGSTRYAFLESERGKADRLATELAEMLGDTAVVRVRHRRSDRGGFFPRPRPARNLPL